MANKKRFTIQELPKVLDQCIQIIGEQTTLLLKEMPANRSYDSLQWVLKAAQTLSNLSKEHRTEKKELVIELKQSSLDELFTRKVK